MVPFIKVSPVNKFVLIKKQTLPSVWPGVCKLQQTDHQIQVARIFYQKGNQPAGITTGFSPMKSVIYKFAERNNV
jgi:hypothetical protein